MTITAPVTTNTPTIGPALGLTGVKAKQQATWASGDYSAIAARIQLISERLAEAAGLRAGRRVLDVACGSGNSSIAAARLGAQVTGVDYVLALLEDARTRAAAERLEAEFELGDAEDLPAADGSFDAAISVVGSMFAPDHEQTAREMVRVTRTGGTIALASWTPDGFIGQMFKVVTRHVTPPAGVQSPVLWGDVDHLRALFGSAAAQEESTEQTFTFRFTSAEEMVGFFRRWYGPTLKAFDAVGEEGQAALEADLLDLVRRYDTYRDGGSVAVPSTYLESVITLA